MGSCANIQIDYQSLITADSGQPMTTSYAVAQTFNKRHSDVLRDIRALLKQCDDGFRERNFALLEKSTGYGNLARNTTSYTMTKNGFLLLVMGYKGDIAVQIKIAYINAFDWMLEQLGLSGFVIAKRHNAVSMERKQHAQSVSASARDMRFWQDDKKLLDAELAYLESKLQPSLLPPNE